MLGFAWGMRRLGKTVTVALDDRVPATFDYLEGTAELAPKPIGEVDVIVFLDGSDRTRFGRFYDLARATGKPLLQIDHHVTNDNFADVNYVDTSAGSCAEIVYDVLGRMGVKTDEKIARCLLTGILTDTLVFRTVGTTPETLEAAIEHHKLPKEAFEWYLDVRRYGSVPHAGFGMGVERCVAWICGLHHVRETIPFARMMERITP